ncbi:MAG TPA: M1 family metallopeptidase [Anaerolineae bacterium]|nr:M1 family metallopeptidase [Anaerolineae bacterium]HQK14147.1 M1 family metallopeptidase [Anaerolineae bacterium]
MKIHRLMLALLCCVGSLMGQTPVSVPAMVPADTLPDVASYVIAATYDPATHTITGQQTATYVNRTSVAIPTLVFHLYLNAFRSTETLWMRESGLGLRGYAYDPHAPGWMRIEQITLDDGTPLTVKSLDDDETLVEAALPQSVAPGTAVTVRITFTAQLPKVFARVGWADNGNFVFAGQWFPKFGVWENGAWNAYPFHANSEFYADFGRYDVALTLPQGWGVAATGTADAAVTVNADGTATHTFVAEHVIDFAWTASPAFRELTRSVDGVAVHVVYYPRQRAMARRALEATAGALPLYNAWFGPYGKGHYPRLTVVIVPPDAGGAGGMEYPTLFTVGAMGGFMPACLRMIEVETVHELGHQWFQSVVATNEAEEPWLDEGFTDYTTVRAMNALYNGALFDCGGWNFSYLAMHRMEYMMSPDTPMAGAAWDYDFMRYGVVAYSKPALSLTTVERTVGETAMRRFLSTYFDRYAFAHPHAEDVRAVMTETLGAEVAGWFFDTLVYGDGTVDAQVVIQDGEVTLERRGEACIPTTVRVTHGRQEDAETIPWPCEQATLTPGDSPRSVEIDPDHAIVLDQNLINNGRNRAPDLATWLGIVVRWTRALQDFFWGGATW